MKTLIRKDLRENLKVALIGLLIFSLLLLHAYRDCIDTLTNLLAGRSSTIASFMQPLLAQSLLTEAAFFCAIFGAALGWLQTRNEAHRDLWAFLIQRPVTRTEIFWGKTIAGLCLYVFGAGLPLAALVAVVRTPGHIAAPFEWAMVLPVVSIFLTGAGFYFAGLLTGLRQARWYASRSFGLGLAIIASFGVFVLPQFWMSLVLITVAVAVLATAARGAYHNGGFYHGQPMTGRLALVVALVAGCGVVLFMCVAMLFTLVLNPLSHHSFVYSGYQMTRDGTIYKVTSQDNEVMEIVDLDGHPLLDPKTGRKMDGKEFYKHIAYGGGVSNNFKRRNENRNIFENGSYFFSLLNVTDKTLWYLDRHGKLIGYDGRTRNYIGSLEAHGFDGASAAEPFLRNPNNYYYYNYYEDMSGKLLATDKIVYLVDFKERTVKPVFTVANDDEIGAYADQSVGYDNNRVNDFLFTTRKIVCLLDQQGQSIFTLPYQPVYFEYPQVSLLTLQQTNGSMNNFAVWFYPDYYTNKAAGWKMPSHVLWLGPGQTVTKSTDLPTLRMPENNPSWPDEAAAALLPPPVHVFIKIEAGGTIYSGWNFSNFAAAFICAAIGWARARRYNFSTRAVIGWSLFILLLNVTGLLALLCAQEWPVRESCPNCKKRRTVDRESCEHCEAPFSAPEKNGTEIFAPLAKV